MKFPAGGPPTCGDIPKTRFPLETGGGMGYNSLRMNLKDYIGEATAYDKKLMLERKDPTSWLKSVSAFANTQGGRLAVGGAVVGGDTAGDVV